MNLKSLVTILFAVSFLTSSVLAGEVCFTYDEGRKILKEITEKRVNDELILLQEQTIENLKKQIELLKQENKLYQEQVILLKQRSELLKTAYEEEKKKVKLSIFEKGKIFGMGMITGALIIMLVGL